MPRKPRVQFLRLPAVRAARSESRQPVSSPKVAAWDGGNPTDHQVFARSFPVHPDDKTRRNRDGEGSATTSLRRAPLPKSPARRALKEEDATPIRASFADRSNPQANR